MQHPHDITDLRLAPVALELDATLERLGSIDGRELDTEIMRATDRALADTADAPARQAIVLETITHDVDLEGWAASWDDRGIRLTHHSHTLVLGLPASLRAATQ